MQDLFLYMIRLYGLREIPGEKHNKIIVRFFQELGYPVHDDETSWCAALVNVCCKMLGYEYPDSLLARDWLNVGRVIQNPKVGDITVLWRIAPDSVYGHVGLYVTERDGYVYLLGGNQQNEVNIMRFEKSRVLGYRRPEHIDVVPN